MFIYNNIYENNIMLASLMGRNVANFINPCTVTPF